MNELQRLVAELVAALDPLAEIELRRALCGEAYRRGRRDGWREGRAALLDEQAAWERELLKPARRTLKGPSFAELEARRWGPGGRARAGDPQPTDHRPGQEPSRGAA